MIVRKIFNFQMPIKGGLSICIVASLLLIAVSSLPAENKDANDKKTEQITRTKGKLHPNLKI